MEAIRACVEIKGVVQGVGFRPFVYDLALENDLKGWVLNDEKGVTIEIEGKKDRVNKFLSGLSSPPPIARIEKTAILYLSPLGYNDFEIKKSKEGEGKLALISPDIATCKDCLNELFDPKDRRFRYPFINCTNCGPRFTIIANVPYDRDNTTMSSFTMCPACSSEYHSPSNRRFHAQPNACPECGPTLQLFTNSGKMVTTHDPVEETIALLKRGKIVAIKGLGGFHLACDATKEEVVAGLRARKYREDKPFALMCRDLEVVKSLCIVDALSSNLISSRERPIVILPRKIGAKIAPSVAPFQKTLGVMLPYTPLHHLLFGQGVDALVMTSGNVSDEPIVFKDTEAFSRLRNIADFFLVHDREIHTRCDDSVVKPLKETVTFLRRARGFAPFPIKLNKKGKHILACGADLKNTFCLTKGDYAFMSQHIGDMENFETMSSFEQGIELFKQLFQITPEFVVHDLHPDYFSTRYAMGLDVPKKIGVQHHFAHALSCMAEYGSVGPALAIVLDGTGYGEDGTVWGGEFLEVSVQGYTRLGHLKQIPLPGGDKAVWEPWRIAAAYLERIYGDFQELHIPFVKELDLERWSQLKLAVKARINAPLCSSMGRLFDAVSALLNVRRSVNYEGQAAVELEQMVKEGESGEYPFEIFEQKGSFIIDPDPIIEAIVKDIKLKESPSIISTRFHNSIAQVISRMAKKGREETGLSDVFLSGGVFQNTFLLEKAWDILNDNGFRVHIHQQIPPNDGCISLGQAFYAIHL
ncbi:MAG: carbamoyltransferase HypF [Deltaproteobacteria bacterium]|nr:MAG: carbamoyltransferase HypF [Deltaproteobacteria bacterium]